MNWKTVPLALAVSIGLQLVGSARVSADVLIVPTACGSSASATLVTVASKPQILLKVAAIGSNAAAELHGVVAHKVNSIQFDTTARFGLLGADSDLEVVALVLDRSGGTEIVRVLASDATRKTLANNYTRCILSGSLLKKFSDVVDLWINCDGPRDTTFPPSQNTIYVTNFFVDGHPITQYAGHSDTSACRIPDGDI